MQIWRIFMSYSYEQGKIVGTCAQNKFGKLNPDWVDLNKIVKDNYPGADFWKAMEKRGNTLYGPKLELKLRNCNKVDPYKSQMEDSSILAVEFDNDGIYHYWFMEDFIEQSEPHSDPQARERGRRQMTRKKYLEGEIMMPLEHIINLLDPSTFVLDPRPATLEAFWI
tara:strand:+ start:581 stop:1081 length:501 start_codon:yes stop_codon:yes gene_type:complete